MSGTAFDGLAAFIRAIPRGGAGGLALLLVDCRIISHVDALWGYGTGDAVASRVSALLQAQVLRENDVIGRLGRDEFACAMSGIGDPAIAQLAAEKVVRALSEAFFAGDDEIFASPCVGVALADSHGEEPEGLLQRARSACDAARLAPDRIAIFTRGHADAAASSFLNAARLQAAVRDDALEMVFRPEYDLQLGQIMGAQACLKWPGANGGLVSAEEAFRAAEGAGNIPALAASILNRALRNVSELRYSAGVDLRLNVQLPGAALLCDELPDLVRASLATWRLRPGRLCLGIGDTGLLVASDLARAMLAQLKSLGVRLAIDDRRLELTALFTLAALPFQEIALEVCAPGAMTIDAKTERIAQSCIELARGLRLDVLAVNPSDETAVEKLRELGCHYLRADWRGPPLDPARFAERYGFVDR